MNPERRYIRYAAITVVVVAVIAATLVLWPHHFEVKVEGEGSVEPADADVRFWETAEFSVVPAEGWMLEGIYLDGESIKADDGVVRLSASVLDFGSHTLRVVFIETGEFPVVDTFTITATSNGHGTIDPSGTIEVNAGDDVTFTLDADAGYRIQTLRVDGTAVAVRNGTYTLTDISADHNVVATFVRISGGGGDPTPSRTLTGIEITQPPVKTVYTEGNSFDPAGMVVTALFSDGSTAVVTDYRWSPTVLGADDTKVTVSYTYGGVTATAEQPVTVSYQDMFDVTVDSVHGTAVVGGSLESFSQDYGLPLSQFGTTGNEPRLFRTDGIIPGISQTAEITIDNGMAFDMEALLSVEDFSGDPELARQLTITVSMGTVEVSKTLYDALSDGISLGTVGAGQSTEVSVTLSFPHSGDNNSVQDMQANFTLGIGGYQRE